MPTKATTDPAALRRILVLDDEEFMLQAWKQILARYDCEVRTLSDPLLALSQIESFKPDVALMDIRMPKLSGLELLKEIKARGYFTEVVIMTAFASIETAVDAVRSGAYDYLTKPFEDIDAAARVVLKAAEHNRLRQRNSELENMLDIQDSFEGLVGSSTSMKKVFEMIEGVAYSPSTVMLQGESGTGKELVARAIHHRSPRRGKPFVAVNCTALTDTLLESELFGHEKGSFTGATATKRGLFEVADGGTLFLDEIGQIPAPTQVKLLRVLQEGEIKRVGSSQNRFVDVRIITATNVDLALAKDQGTFREDLFYRLNVIAIRLPPLRERPGDIPLLAHHFLRKYNKKTAKNIEAISSEVLSVFERHAWPGNVRELENVMERAVVLGRSNEVRPLDLPENMQEARPARSLCGAGDEDLCRLPYADAKAMAVADFDRRYLVELMQQTSGNVSQASRQAGMDRSNFRRLLKRYDIDAGEVGQDSPAPTSSLQR